MTEKNIYFVDLNFYFQKARPNSTKDFACLQTENILGVIFVEVPGIDPIAKFLM
jgi:hypothetical protein